MAPRVFSARFRKSDLELEIFTAAGVTLYSLQENEQVMIFFIYLSTSKHLNSGAE